jgi:hypothetical protein
MAMLLLSADATVTVVHSRTPPDDVKSIVESSGDLQQSTMEPFAIKPLAIKPLAIKPLKPEHKGDLTSYLKPRKPGHEGKRTPNPEPRTPKSHNYNKDKRMNAHQTSQQYQGQEAKDSALAQTYTLNPKP